MHERAPKHGRERGHARQIQRHRDPRSAIFVRVHRDALSQQRPTRSMEMADMSRALA